jgi:hypothetical protein
MKVSCLRDACDILYACRACPLLAEESPPPETPGDAGISGA